MSRRQVEKTIAYSLLLFSIILAFYLGQKSMQLCLNLIIGLFFGMIMARTAFSFTGNLRNPILKNDYSYTKLFFLMTVITCIGLNVGILIGTLSGTFDWETFLTKPTNVSLYFCISAVIFGFGVCLVGSAGSGIIRKAANCKFEFIVTMFFYFIGSVLGVIVRNFALTYMPEHSLYMPEIFGWPLAITIQGILLLVSYLFIQYKTSGGDDSEKKN